MTEKEEKKAVAEDRVDMISGDTEKSVSSVKNPGLIIKLMTPFQFDGAKVTEIDLNGLYDLSAHDLIQIEGIMLRNGYSGQNMELTTKYALLAAAKAAGKAWEFCDEIKSRDAIRIKNIVTGFFYMRS